MNEINGGAQKFTRSTNLTQSQSCDNKIGAMLYQEPQTKNALCMSEFQLWIMLLTHTFKIGVRSLMIEEKKWHRVLHFLILNSHFATVNAKKKCSEQLIGKL